MGTTSKRRVWSSKQTEVSVDSSNSFVNKTIDRRNIYWFGKFDQSYHPEPSLNQETSHTHSQWIRHQWII